MDVTSFAWTILAALKLPNMNQKTLAVAQNKPAMTRSVYTLR